MPWCNILEISHPAFWSNAFMAPRARVFSFLAMSAPRHRPPLAFHRNIPPRCVLRRDSAAACRPGPFNWKGFLRLSLVTCPVALYPATSESEKISFNQLNKQTDHRIKYVKVDAHTGEEVPNEDIVKGIEVSKEELEELALESTRTIDIDEFVEKSEIDPRYLIRPYYLRPDGKVGHDALSDFAGLLRASHRRAVDESRPRGLGRR
jgi:hypothetical protein